MVFARGKILVTLLVDYTIPEGRELFRNVELQRKEGTKGVD
jgi:hypothetical protein